MESGSFSCVLCDMCMYAGKKKEGNGRKRQKSPSICLLLKEEIKPHRENERTKYCVGQSTGYAAQKRKRMKITGEWLNEVEVMMNATRRFVLLQF
jgi:hypothetical protein